MARRLLARGQIAVAGPVRPRPGDHVSARVGRIVNVERHERQAGLEAENSGVPLLPKAPRTRRGASLANGIWYRKEATNR